MTIVAGIVGGILAAAIAIGGWVLVVNRQLRRAEGLKAWGE